MSVPSLASEGIEDHAQKVHSPFQSLHVRLGVFLLFSFSMKGQSTEELNQVQGFSSYLLAIRYHCTSLNYLFQLPRQVCGKFPYSFNGNQIADFKPKFFICTTA